MTAREIYDIIKANEHNFRSFGIRTCNDEYVIGDECAASYNWDDERDEEDWELLDGTCATGFDYLYLYDDPTEEDIADDVAAIEKALEINRKYRGKHMYLIAGMGDEYGNDEAEIIISGAEVLAIVK